MSTCGPYMNSAVIDQLLEPHLQDLGGFIARRILPHDRRMTVGPFIFFDHIGPATFPPGRGIDVRPHPHINLATVTYLFEGSLLHRDSLGTIQEIHPGAVNWMTAGCGIAHSERSPDDFRTQTATLHGIQTWVALPMEYEEIDPSFHHYPKTDLPTWEKDGASATLIAGKMGEYQSPVKVFSPMLYLDLQLASNATFTLPAEYPERAIYTVTDGLRIAGEPLDQHRLVLLPAGVSVSLSAQTPSRCIVIGGESVGDRIKWWNFVSSRPERIEQAKQDWKARRFDRVPQETEFIPLPDA
jgi:redox-sensitive bicupin YhaK (pirin superfamily)